MGRRGLVRRSPGVALIVLGLLSGCGLLSAPRLHVTIRNQTNVPAQIQMVEFNHATGEFGAALGAVTNVAAGGSARLEVPIPNAEQWALRINDFPAVTSVGLAQNELGLPGQGPLTFSISVQDESLETQVSRGGANAGATTAPAPN